MAYGLGAVPFSLAAVTVFQTFELASYWFHPPSVDCKVFLKDILEVGTYRLGIHIIIIVIIVRGNGVFLVLKSYPICSSSYRPVSLLLSSCRGLREFMLCSDVV